MKITFAKIDWLSFKNIKKHLVSIYEDIKNGKFKMRKWHLHSIALLISIGINALMVWSHKIHATHWMAMPFRSLYEANDPFFDSAVIGRVFLQFIGYFILSYVPEMYQGLKGANRTELEKFESNKDAIFTFICFELGVLISELIF